MKEVAFGYIQIESDLMFLDKERKGLSTKTKIDDNAREKLASLFRNTYKFVILANTVRVRVGLTLLLVGR